MSFPQSDIERRLANLFRVGTVESVDHAAARARVRIGAILTAPLPWLTMRAGADRTWWPVEPGEQVVVLSPSGDTTQGVILPALYCNAGNPPSNSSDVDRHEYADGAVVEYDRNAHTLRATIPGDIEASATGSIKATAGADITASAGGKIDATAVNEITLAAPLVTLEAGLIRLAGPVAASGRNGESYTAEFSGDITQTGGNFTNIAGDVLARGVSLHDHTHAENGDGGGETDAPS